MRIALTCILFVSILLTTGCSWFTPPNEQPVIEEKLNKAWLSDAKVGTLSLTPDRRVVLVNFSNNRFCAEAPTEVGLDISRLIKLTADATGGDEIKAGFEAISAATSSATVLNKRTQGMQLFLANAYFVCQMYMNGAITETQLMELQLLSLNAVGPLIEKELSIMYEALALGDADDKGSASDTFVPMDIEEVMGEVLEKESPPEQ